MNYDVNNLVNQWVNGNKEFVLNELDDLSRSVALAAGVEIYAKLTMLGSDNYSSSFIKSLKEKIKYCI